MFKTSKSLLSSAHVTFYTDVSLDTSMTNEGAGALFPLPTCV